MTVIMCTLFGGVCNVIPFLPMLVIVAAFWQEDCDQPIRVFLLVQVFVFALNIVLTLLFIRRVYKVSQLPADDAQAGDGQMSPQTQYCRRIGFIWIPFIFLFLFENVWYIVGQRWTYAMGSNCPDVSPHMHTMAVASFIINYVLGALGCVLMLVLCCCWYARAMQQLQQAQMQQGPPPGPGFPAAAGGGYGGAAGGYGGGALGYGGGGGGAPPAGPRGNVHGF